MFTISAKCNCCTVSSNKVFRRKCSDLDGRVRIGHTHAVPNEVGGECMSSEQMLSGIFGA